MSTLITVAVFLAAGYAFGWAAERWPWLGGLAVVFCGFQVVAWLSPPRVAWLQAGGWVICGVVALWLHRGNLRRHAMRRRVTR